ncbi:NADH ubiquinone oxidoreductase 20 kDa subunit [Thiorhodococcus drewsii AZ1]|uniref:hydrogenase (acceptor) n=1 Tax=Thiorhodococcus drewsii AZ1 TaxID=765913 RepID=G2E3R4_9GAMM|nr:NADH ubiquinone dehydrogenase [Thiorhodococcus drewsii]EGV30006.1 NADH ubiquinone oxidoreductase 20 kDa subunit [Thiorhodococcus drewsii AZ1]
MSAPLGVLWLQSGGCGGCTMSLLNAESPELPGLLDAAGLRLIWHPSLSEASGDEVVSCLERLERGDEPLDLLCVEGALLRGPNGSGRFHLLSGTDRPMIDWVQSLAARARCVVAMGTCAAYGGITAGADNPTDACGLQYEGVHPGGLLGADFRAVGGLPVVNIAGCPIHPNWVGETLAALALGALVESDLDPYQRPRMFYDHLVHHGCPRNEFYEYKASALEHSDLGCLMEHLGCLGTQAHADCNTRLWNGQGSCTRGGYACINCTAPEFEEPGHGFQQTPSVAGIPVGLPTDMPKAWFVALASLSKAATPQRLRLNATADHLVVPPSVRHTRQR